MRSRLLRLLLLMVPSACGPAASDDAGSDLPLLTVSEPTVQIGVVEGDEAYTFGAISGLIRLPDGGIAVADGGTSRISLYDATGGFVRSWGSRGEGPGEFRTLSRLYATAGDSLIAADASTSRLSVFALDGTLARQLDAMALSRDSTFQLDSWLYGRFWVDGALSATERGAAERTLDRLPPPRDPPGYRMVRAASDGSLWIQEPRATVDSSTSWIRANSEGAPTGMVELPARFRPFAIDGEDVLGVWLDESDVNFVRAYRLVDAGATQTPPLWLTTVDSASLTTPPPTDAELAEVMRQTIRSLAMAQEMNYSRNYSYTTAIDSLEFERPAELQIDFTHANTRGWAAVFTHPSVDRLCGLGYGFGSPPGWAPGAINCGRASTNAPAR
jgi:hypothetical protein